MDLKEFLKKGFEAIVRDKLFVLAAIALATLWLPGCATLRDKMMEPQREELELAKKDALKWREDFLNCISNYARKNTQASASPTEIAEAAVPRCQFSLEMYKYYQSDYNSLLYSSPLGTSVTAEKKEEEKTRLDVQELIEEGKRRVIKILVDMRQ